MNIEQFNETYAAFRDVDKIEIVCDHPQHKPTGEIIVIGKQPAKRNILKNESKAFICRQCFMKYNNPMNRVGESRQTDEVIQVFCPHPEHAGDHAREMKKTSYYGVMAEPYLQVCGSCAQKGKTVSEEQREKIRISLTGIKRSEEFKEKLREYMRTNPEGIARGEANLIPGAGGGWNKGSVTPEDVRQKQSIAMTGRTYTDEHRQNISEGRKKMLAEQGGFTREHREKISKATILQYQNGFEPHLHHLRGWHESPKAGKVYFRSSYEKKAFLKLDEDEAVKTYQVEAVSTDYFHPMKEITSSYLIDLLVEYIDGSQKLIEIKPERWLTDEVIIAKIEAGEAKAADMKIPYEIWTEMDLFGHVYNKGHMRSFFEKVKRGEL